MADSFYIGAAIARLVIWAAVVFFPRMPMLAKLVVTGAIPILLAGVVVPYAVNSCKGPSQGGRPQGPGNQRRCSASPPPEASASIARPSPEGVIPNPDSPHPHRPPGARRPGRHRLPARRRGAREGPPVERYRQPRAASLTVIVAVLTATGCG